MENTISVNEAVETANSLQYAGGWHNIGILPTRYSEIINIHFAGRNCDCGWYLVKKEEFCASKQVESVHPADKHVLEGWGVSKERLYPKYPENLNYTEPEVFPVLDTEIEA